MSSIIQIHESEFRNKAGVELMACLHNFKYPFQKEGEIKVLTSQEFISNNPILKAFNTYLATIRTQGVKAIFIKTYV